MNCGSAITATRSASGSAAISRYTGFVSSGCSVHCKPEQEPDGARRDLAGHRHAVGVGRREQLELAAPAVAAHLHERERQRPARLLGHAPEDRELGVDVGEVGDDLQHAPTRLRRSPRAMPTSSSASAVSVGVCSPLLVRWLSVREVENPSAPASIALAREPAIASMSSAVAGLAPGAALAHHVQPQRAVRHLHRDVDVERPARRARP